MKYGIRSAHGMLGVFDTESEAIIERAALVLVDLRYLDSTVVRVLSHEEAKRKAAAVALLQAAEVIDENFTSTYNATKFLREQAEALWPALFHAGDGMKPRGK